MKKAVLLFVVLSLLIAATSPALAMEPVPVPEPSTLALIVAGVVGLAGFWRIRK